MVNPIKTFVCFSSLFDTDSYMLGWYSSLYILILYSIYVFDYLWIVLAFHSLQSKCLQDHT